MPLCEAADPVWSPPDAPGFVFIRRMPMLDKTEGNILLEFEMWFTMLALLVLLTVLVFCLLT